MPCRFSFCWGQLLPKYFVSRSSFAPFSVHTSGHAYHSTLFFWLFLVFTGDVESIEACKRTASGRPDDKQSKLVRFGRGEGQSMEDESGWSEPLIKDSGIDTGFSSSSQTLNEELLKVDNYVCQMQWRANLDLTQSSRWGKCMDRLSKKKKKKKKKRKRTQSNLIQ